MQQIVSIGVMTLGYLGYVLFSYGKRKKVFDGKKEAVKLLFAVYLFCVVSVTLFPIYIHLDTAPSWEKVRVNLIPFQFLKDFSALIRYDAFYVGIAVKNIAGNILMFMPLGLLAPFVSQRFQSVKSIGILSFCISFCIECIQAIQMYFGIGLRITDVDDLILNVCGGFIGYLFYSVLTSNNKRKITC